jgi:hypothetical protein
MRGHKVTEREVNSILRLAGYQNLDGEWVHSYESIAQVVDLDFRTVATVIRKAAIQWGRHTRWRQPDAEDDS